MGVTANVIIVNSTCTLGIVSGIELSTPYWSDTGELRAKLVDRFGCEFDVLRMYANTGYDDGKRMNGTISYVVQAYPTVGQVIDVERFDGALPPDIRRARYGEVDGPAAEVAWAQSHLELPVVEIEQTRSWNLSAVWRLRTATGEFWLKSVPDFFGHEGRVIDLVAAMDSSAVPSLVAHEPGRILMRPMPGVEQYGAPIEMMSRVIRRVVPLQLALANSVDELLAADAPDWREGPLTAAVADVVKRHAHELDSTEFTAVERLVSELPQRFAEVARSGVPDTLVHGDCHPGNVRVDDEVGSLIIFDWGDSGVGCPLLDYPAMASQSGPDAAAEIQRMLCEAWRVALPGCDPERALRAIEPIAALRQATIYRKFLDNIEAAEHIYHADDPQMWLKEAARLATSEVL